MIQKIRLRNTRLGSVLVAALGSFVASIAFAAGDFSIGNASSKPVPGKELIIRLETFASCRTCQAYELRIERNGSVTYTGKQLVRVTGVVRSKIEKSQVDKLVASIMSIDFFSLPESELVEGPLVDVPIAEISFNNEMKAKSVRFRMLANGRTADLTKVANEIREATHVRQWLCPAPTTITVSC